MKTFVKISMLMLTMLSMGFSESLQAQSPEKMSYQAVIRDGSDNLITSSNVGMRIQILQGSISGTSVYEETHTPNTNANGLVSIQVGAGNVVSGDFTNIDWANGSYYIKNEIDPTGGTNYVVSGTSELLSVPYALHAKTAENTNGDGLWSEDNNDIYYDSGNVGIGSSNPRQDLDIVNPSSSVRVKSTTPGTIFNPSGDAFLILDKASFSNNANLNLQSEGEIKFYAGLLGTNNFSISTDLSILDGLEVKSDGDVNISGELQTEDTGNANMIPIAYGTYIHTDGGLVNSSGNISVDPKGGGLNGAQYFSIVLDNVNQFNFNEYTISLTSLSGTDSVYYDRLSTFSLDSGDFSVRTINADGVKFWGDFSIIIYKP